MQIKQTTDEIKFYRERTREAISLATKGQWQGASEANKALLSRFPKDVEALNRLGKALSELGIYTEARIAFQSALEFSPSNSISKQNLERILGLRDSFLGRQSARVTPEVFIEERGKSCVTTLCNSPDNMNFKIVAAGDVVLLKIDGATVLAATFQGNSLGQIEPKLAARLIKLLTSGNKYVVAVASIVNGGISLMVREVYKHPSMSVVVSFPSRSEGIIPYGNLGDGELFDLEEDVATISEWSEVQDEQHDIGFRLTTRQTPFLESSRNPIMESDSADEDDPFSDH